MQKTVFTYSIAVALVLLCSLKSQSQDTATVYIVKPGISTITKEEFFKSDSLLLDCNNCRIINLTVIVSGTPKIKSKQVSGNKIPEDIRQFANSSDSALVTFAEIRLEINGKGRWIRPFTYKVK